MWYAVYRVRSRHLPTYLPIYQYRVAFSINFLGALIDAVVEYWEKQRRQCTGEGRERRESAHSWRDPAYLMRLKPGQISETRKTRRFALGLG